MNILVCARVALRALRVNPLRSILTMLGIIIGVGAVIAMVSVGAGAQARVAEQLRSLGSNLILILPGSVASTGVRLGFGTRPTITQEDALAIARELPSIHSTAPSVRGRDQVVWGNTNWSTGIQGTTPDYEETRQWPVVAGRWFTPDEAEGAAKVVLLGQTVAENVFGGADPVGVVVRVAGVPLTVIGVLERKGQSSWGQDQDDVVIIPILTANKRVLGPTKPSATSVNAMSGRKTSMIPVSTRGSPKTWRYGKRSISTANSAPSTSGPCWPRFVPAVLFNLSARRVTSMTPGAPRRNGTSTSTPS